MAQPHVNVGSRNAQMEMRKLFEPVVGRRQIRQHQTEQRESEHDET